MSRVGATCTATNSDESETQIEKCSKTTRQKKRPEVAPVALEHADVFPRGVLPPFFELETGRFAMEYHGKAQHFCVKVRRTEAVAPPPISPMLRHTSRISLAMSSMPPASVINTFTCAGIV